MHPGPAAAFVQRNLVNINPVRRPRPTPTITPHPNPYRSSNPDPSPWGGIEVGRGGRGLRPVSMWCARMNNVSRLRDDPQPIRLVRCTNAGAAAALHLGAPVKLPAGEGTLARKLTPGPLRPIFYSSHRRIFDDPIFRLPIYITIPYSIIPYFTCPDSDVPHFTVPY